jgi:hypothetical protein
MTFKVGDRVRITKPDIVSMERGYKPGEEFIVSYTDRVLVKNSEDHGFYFSEIELVSTSNNKTTMPKKLGAIAKRLLDGDTKTLVKAGYINGDLELTDEGTAALNAVIFEQNKAALVEAAKAEIEETKQA